MNNKFYLTTAIPYVNAKPHIGHALEYFYADTIRRFYESKGYETLLLSGADENALKNVQAAEKEGLSVNAFLDKYSEVFINAYEKLGVHLDKFQRGSDKQKHWPGVQKLWKMALGNGDIYKKSYEGLYCVGCESFKTTKELVNGKCTDHDKEPEKVSEENYFFKLSKYQEKILKLIESDTLKIRPENKRAETISFIKSGLEDFSVSRSKKRARGVGVPVPGDENQVIYVWFDALNIYMTGVGFGHDEENWNKWWPADLHIIGKDINRFHTIYWPAMLLSADIPLPKQIYIHGFVTVEGQKISKSIGNVVDPLEVSGNYGLEPLRYFLLSQIPYDGDGSFTIERFEEVYEADLANGLGNLVSRISKLAETANYEPKIKRQSYDPNFEELIIQFKINEAFSLIWTWIAQIDKKINDEKPWIYDLKENDGAKKLDIFLSETTNELIKISYHLWPLLPQTSEIIRKQFLETPIKKGSPLFKRIGK